jgi:KipI family sensor histidine kinase inhibitor
MSDGRILTAGDSCLIVEFASVIDPAVSGRCAAMASAIRARHVVGVRDVVPAYNTVAVHFDPLQLQPEKVVALFDQAERAGADMAAQPSAIVDIPVVYGGESGPDLAGVASFGNCSEEEVVRLHSESVYHVYMLGFLPGFAYMGPVDPRIAAPRLATPRVKVPAGSVGIAGRQTGVYPLDSPGGWQIIGRTDVTLFSPTQANPFLLRPGDQVRFVPVDSRPSR